MTANDWAIASSAIGFIGGIILFIPGWRGSTYLRQIEKVRKIAVDTAESTSDPGQELLDIMSEQNAQWSQTDHRLLIAGISAVTLSFAIDFLTKLG